MKSHLKKIGAVTFFASLLIVISLFCGTIHVLAAPVIATTFSTVYDSPSGGHPVVMGPQKFGAKQEWFLVSTYAGDKWIGFNENQFGNVIFDSSTLKLTSGVYLLNSPSDATHAGYLEPQSVKVKQEWFLVDTQYGLKFLGFNAPCPVVFTLNIEPNFQGTTSWCWATSLKTIIGYLKPSVSSPSVESIVQSVTGKVNVDGTERQTVNTITKALDIYQLTYKKETSAYAPFNNGSISFNTIKDCVKGWYSPILTTIAQGGEDNPTHAMVIFGFYEYNSIQYVYYMDPAAPDHIKPTNPINEKVWPYTDYTNPNFYTMTYNDFKKNKDFKWYSTWYYIKAK